MAYHAASRYDAAYLRHVALGTDALCGRYAGKSWECFFEGRPIRDEYLIVQGGKLAGTGAHSYSEGDATKGSEEAAKFKR